MNQPSLKFGIIIFAFLFYLPCAAQIKIKTSESELFREVESHEKIVAECERKRREYQISKFGKVLPKVSGHCWEGCPTSVVKPYHPSKAKRLNISGEVKVETIVDEKGKVIYARFVKGNLLFKRAVLRAAYLSTHTPKKSCDDKPIKFRWTITYNFH
jgi:hypothetical protein